MIPELVKQLFGGDHSCIYALVDSRDPAEFRYVGISRNPQKRLRQHLAAAKQGGEQNRRAVWIRSVLSSGAQINVCILAYVQSQVAPRIESEYIRFMAGYGFALVNSTSGGQRGYVRSPDTAALLSLKRRELLAADPSFVKRLSVSVRLAFADEDVRRQCSERMLRWFADPGNRASHREQVIKVWEDTEHRERHRAVLNDPDVAARRRAGMVQAWTDPEVRSRRVASVTAALQRADVRAKLSAHQKRRFTDPKERRKHSDVMKASWAKRNTLGEAEGSSE